MRITDVRVRLVKKDDSKLKGVASVTFDECFVVHDIKIIEGDKLRKYIMDYQKKHIAKL